MNRQNWYAQQLVEDTNLTNLESVAQNGTNALAALLKKGIVSGMVVSQTGSISTQVSVAAGTVVLEDGTVVTSGVAKTVDLAPFLGAQCTVLVLAIPYANSDTPVVTPTSGTINYRLFDDYALVAQLISAPRNPIPETVYVGTLLATVNIPAAEPTVVNAYITQADATVCDRWIPIGTLARYNTHLLLASTTTPTLPTVFGLSFEMILTADAILQPVTNLNPGDEFTVILVQDGTGGHAFTWAAGVPGDAPDATAGAISTQRFKKTFDGRIVNMGGMTVNS